VAGVPVAKLRTSEQTFCPCTNVAGMIASRGVGIPALRYFIKSFPSKPVWPSGVYRSQRASFPHMVHAAAQPFSGRVHEAMAGLRPDHWGRRAVLEQRSRRQSRYAQYTRHETTLEHPS
jgi:hypothetical protein